MWCTCSSLHQPRGKRELAFLGEDLPSGRGIGNQPRGCAAWLGPAARVAPFQREGAIPCRPQAPGPGRRWANASFPAFSPPGPFTRAARLFAWCWLAFSSSSRSWRLPVHRCCRGCRCLRAALPVKHCQEPVLPWEMDVPSAWKSLVKGNVIPPRTLFWYLGVFLTTSLSCKLCFQ